MAEKGVPMFTDTEHTRALVSAVIDVHDGTDMHCHVSRQSGAVELRLGDHPEAYLTLSRSSAEKLVRALSAAGLSSPARS
jgi:hypothetical protein